jgi:uncharacterized membrane protein
MNAIALNWALILGASLLVGIAADRVLAAREPAREAEAARRRASKEMRTNIVANIVAIIAGITANSIFFILGVAILARRQPIELQFALVEFIEPIIVVLVALVAKKAALGSGLTA